MVMGDLPVKLGTDLRLGRYPLLVSHGDAHQMSMEPRSTSAMRALGTSRFTPVVPIGPLATDEYPCVMA
jgi:hypothetical protein